jgi:hypothetical protein
MKLRMIVVYFLYTTLIAMDNGVPWEYTIKTVQDVMPFMYKFVVLSREGSGNRTYGYITPFMSFLPDHPLSPTIYNGIEMEKIIKGRVVGTVTLSNFTLDPTWRVEPHNKPLTIRFLTSQEFNLMVNDVREHGDIVLRGLLGIR